MGSARDAGAMPWAARHTPVLLAEVVRGLAPRTAGIYCDATLGDGGHARAVLEASSPDGQLIGIDRDPEAIDRARAALADFGGRVTFVQAPFSQVGDVLRAQGLRGVDGCLADLGVSSPQLDTAARGFSFQHDGPLDMRMDPTSGESAAELLARIDGRELETILRELGEERHAARIARALIERRRQRPVTTTGQLAALVAEAAPTRERNKHPATRTFQALRIAINDELGELRRFLADAPGELRAGGRLAVIAFHSLEDRLVKRRFRELARDGRAAFRLTDKHVVKPTRDECRRNPRARSARLRILERLAPP